MITVDNRCGVPTCSGDIYRMVGHCTNCGVKPVLILYTKGHEALGPTSKPCPTCGNHYAVRPDRLATEDEIPAAIESEVVG